MRAKIATDICMSRARSFTNTLQASQPPARHSNFTYSMQSGRTLEAVELRLERDLALEKVLELSNKIEELIEERDAGLGGLPMGDTSAHSPHSHGGPDNTLSPYQRQVAPAPALKIYIDVSETPRAVHLYL